MSKKIFKSIDEFIKSNNPEFDELLEHIIKLAESNEPTLKTLATRYSNIKKHIRNNYPIYSEVELKQIKPSDEVIKEIIQDDLEKRSQKTNIRFNDELINNILSLKDSNNDLDKSIYLQFISGRRINEIKSNDYILKPYKDKLKMNLSKCKDTKMNEIFLIPNTLTSKEFKKETDNLRLRINDIGLTDWNSRINRHIKKNIGKDITSHNLRGIYAVYNFNKNNPNNLNINGYLTQVLNHSSYDASLNYSNYVYEN